MSSWSPKDSKRALVSVARLLLIMALCAYARHPTAVGWYRNENAIGAINFTTTNPNSMLAIADVPPMIDNLIRSALARVTWSVSAGRCIVDEERCVASPNWPYEHPGNESCIINVPYPATWTIDVKRFQTCPSRSREHCYFLDSSTHGPVMNALTVNGLKFDGNVLPQDILPIGSIAWEMGNIAHAYGMDCPAGDLAGGGGCRWRLCPRKGVYALSFLAVGRLRGIANACGFCLGAAALLGTVALAGAAPLCRSGAAGRDAPARAPVSCREDEQHLMHPRVDAVTQAELASQIDTICAEWEEGAVPLEKLRELRGVSRAAKPAWVFAPSLTTSFILLHVALDLTSAHTFIMNGDLWLAAGTLAIVVYSTSRQFVSGHLQHLRTELHETVRMGKLSNGLLGTFDEEQGGEAIVSLLISGYGLPLSVKTSLQATLALLSVALGTWGAASFTFRTLDLEGSHWRLHSVCAREVRCNEPQ